ncbi:protein MICROTUBULE BINDING PROTEIN 2C isoform X2 [Diospyros lotus]|uniref:protein MICROTUBULE BINDING PROTEIN 2C isoform X2 n=1 Tax=Diospyros lotus TaxID=55363 RepID=UPI002259169B|nr:protein MICROTUBULE BINDING PROTEIN 2C isoform X2 [Diospyros lotus]
MYEPQHFVDLQDNSGLGDPKSWLSGEDHPTSPALRRTHSSLSTAAGSSGDVDRVLFNDLVEMVPLVQSLIDRKANSSYTRRGSMIYTKTPSRESLSKKIIEPKGKSAAQSLPPKKPRDHADKHQGKNLNDNRDGGSDNFSIFSSSAIQMENEELITLREQVEDLQRRLLEKDEILKSAEISKTQVSSTHAKLEEMKLQTAEKDSLLKSTQLQLSDAKIKLADKQAAVEKLQWEAMNSNRKVEKLQEDLGSMQEEISSFMLLFDSLTNNSSTKLPEDYDITHHHSNHSPQTDDFDQTEMQKIEEAREAYVDAVAAAKEKQDEDSIAAAASARLRLQSFVFRTSV